MRKVLPARLAYGITRKKNIFWQQAFYKKARSDPEKVKDLLLKEAKKELPDDYVDEHHFLLQAGVFVHVRKKLRLMLAMKGGCSGPLIQYSNQRAS